MANVARPRGKPTEEGLLLVVRNERPILAADLAELFNNLAKDYRKTSGRDLVIARISEGSLIALLHDAAGFLGDANTLIAFGKTLAALTKIALGASAGASKLINTRKAGTQTIKSLAKMALASDGDVEMQYHRTWAKEELFLKINRSDAERIQKFSLAKSPPQIAATKQSLLSAPSSREVTNALVQMSKRGDGQSASDLQAIIDAIVGTLATHDSSYVFEIAADLEAQGHHTVARLLRDAYENLVAHRKSEPPLLT